MISTINRHRKGIAPFSRSAYIGGGDVLNWYIRLKIGQPTWEKEGILFLQLQPTTKKTKDGEERQEFHYFELNTHCGHSGMELEIMQQDFLKNF